MARFIVFIFFFTSAFLVQAENFKIRFGSCIHQNKASPILHPIYEENPDLFIFLGDNVYADTEDLSVMQRKYQKQAEKPEFKQLVDSTSVIAIWDDHDYGENDAGQGYKEKEGAREIMLDFWQEPKDSARRIRPDGIYTSYLYGEEGKRIQIIMPDLRWNRTSLKKLSFIEYEKQKRKNNKGPYLPQDDEVSQMLGEEQWQWLEKELLKPAEIKIIASSLQLLPEFTGWESWANFPRERDRLLHFIKENNINGVLMISGDTHWGELSKVEIDKFYPLYEVTSSGLNQEWKKVSPNKHRIADPYSKVNYGFIDINWSVDDPMIELGIKDIEGSVISQQRFSLSHIYHVK